MTAVVSASAPKPAMVEAYPDECEVVREKAPRNIRPKTGSVRRQATETPETVSRCDSCATVRTEARFACSRAEARVQHLLSEVERLNSDVEYLKNELARAAKKEKQQVYVVTSERYFQGSRSEDRRQLRRERFYFSTWSKANRFVEHIASDLGVKRKCDLRTGLSYFQYIPTNIDAECRDVRAVVHELPVYEYEGIKELASGVTVDVDALDSSDDEADDDEADDDDLAVEAENVATSLDHDHHNRSYV